MERSRKKSDKTNVDRLNLGVSLFEVIGIVAVTCILAAIAIPQYKVYTSKSRQNESYQLLTAYYAAAQASFTEMNAYPGNFVSMGFAPEGVLHYRISAADNATALPLGVSEDTSCTTTNTSFCKTFRTWVEDATTDNFHIAEPVSIPTIADVSFSAVASGIIKPNGTVDEWTINQAKIMTNTVSGL